MWILIVLFGGLTVLHMPNVFPNITIPVLVLVWAYADLLSQALVVCVHTVAWPRLGRRHVQAAVLCLAALTTTISCGPNGSYAHLAPYLHSQGGFQAWQRGEGDLQKQVNSAADHYQQTHALQDLQVYEEAVRKYLNHGMTLYRVYTAVGYRLPKGLLPSLDRRTNKLMDLANEYLRQGSTPVAVSIAREMIINYGDLNVMNRAQLRAEDVLIKYSYQTDY
jgi:hypothetical protein